MTSSAPDRTLRGPLTVVEAVLLAVMAAILVAIAIPSYAAMRDRSHDSAARAQVRRAAEAIETRKAERGTYAVSGAGVLEQYATGVDPSKVEVVSARRSSYCVQSSVGGRTWHAAGPAGDVARGSCP